MSDTTTAPTQDALQPAEIVARYDAAAEKFKSPSGDGTMVWRKWGSGPPIVLLHGGYGSWLHWINNIDALSPNFELWAPDMPGYGESALPPMPFDLSEYADVIIAGMRSLILKDGRGPVDLVGFSFGGWIAGTIAEKLGSDVRNLVLIGTVGLGHQGPSSEMKSWRKASDPAELAAIQRHNLGAMMIANTELVDDLAVYTQIVNTRDSRLRRDRGVGRDSLRDSLPNVKARIYGIWGELDVPATPNITERCAFIDGVRPDSVTRLFPGVGHWLSYEAAGDFNAMIRDLPR